MKREGYVPRGNDNYRAAVGVTVNVNHHYSQITPKHNHCRVPGVANILGNAPRRSFNPNTVHVFATPYGTFIYNTKPRPVVAPIVGDVVSNVSAGARPPVAAL